MAGLGVWWSSATNPTLFVGLSVNISDAASPDDSPVASSSRVAPARSGVQVHDVWMFPWLSAVTVQTDGLPAGVPVAVLITFRSTASPAWKPLPVMVAVWPGE